MTSAQNTMHGCPAGKPRRELRASDGFGPLDSSVIPRTPETARTPCLAGRWFSPRPPRRNAEPAPCLTALTPRPVAQ